MNDKFYRFFRVLAMILWYLFLVIVFSIVYGGLRHGMGSETKRRL